MKTVPEMRASATTPEHPTHMRATIGWTTERGRFHIWFDQNADYEPGRGNLKWLPQRSSIDTTRAPAGSGTIYLNPADGGRTRYMDLDGKGHAYLLEAALALANSGAIEADAERQLAEQRLKDEELDRQRAAWVRHQFTKFLADEVVRYTASGNTELASRVQAAAVMAEDLGDASLLLLDRYIHGLNS